MGKGTSKKSISFDLEGYILKNNLNKEDYTKAYYDIRHYLEKNGFEHTQESSYVSKEGITFSKVQDLLEEMVNMKEYSYLKGAFKNINISSLGRTYELVDFIQDEDVFTLERDENLYNTIEKNHNIDTKDSLNMKRQIRFDIVQEKLESYFNNKQITKNPLVTYEWLKDFFEEKGYKKEQHSVYVSTTRKTNAQVVNDLLDLKVHFEAILPNNEFNEFSKCFDSIQLTHIGRVYDITDLINGNVKEEVIDLDDNFNKEKETSIGLER